MPVDDAPIAPGHEYRLHASETPVDVDGYRAGEPKELACAHCDARMLITADPTPGIWSVTHTPACPNASDDGDE